MKLPAVFLDRDGVIIQEKHFLINASEIEFIPGAIEALHSLDEYLKVVISNQSGVARGYFTVNDVEDFQGILATMLSEKGVEINSWRFCPHSPDDNCNCRKPNPGMIIEEAQKLSIDLDKSWMIGDKTSDIAAGRAAGVKTILVRTGYAGKEPGADKISPDYWADDLIMAAAIIKNIK
jgi:D-glycero-D-manno-heptose 1,7-bisphosphate phosphatase